MMQMMNQKQNNRESETDQVSDSSYTYKKTKLQSINRKMMMMMIEKKANKIENGNHRESIE
jgi:hypothetical protein